MENTQNNLTPSVYSQSYEYFSVISYIQVSYDHNE